MAKITQQSSSLPNISAMIDLKLLVIFSIFKASTDDKATIVSYHHCLIRGFTPNTPTSTLCNSARLQTCTSKEHTHPDL